jgi:hypothetical protein
VKDLREGPFAMNVDPEQLKQFLLAMIERIRFLEGELAANRAVIHHLQDTSGVPMDDAVGKARTSPDLQALLDGRYNALVQRVLGPIDEAIARQEMAELMKMWNPDAPVN